MFRLEKVLRHREREERAARAARLELERRRDELGETLHRLRAERATLPEGDARPAGTERVLELAAWAAYAEGLRRRERSVRDRMAEIDPKLEEAVRAHTALRQEVEGLRKLRERERERRRIVRERRLQETIDDAAARRRLPGPGTECPPPPPRAVRAGGLERALETAEGVWNPDRGTER